MSVLYVRDKDGNLVPVQTIKGEKGEKGDKGDTPERGTDYWTEADKTEIINTVLATLPAAEGVSY